MTGRRIRFADDVVGGETAEAIGSTPTPTPGGVSNYHKRTKTDQFSAWRRGNYNWVEAERQAEIKAVVHPRPGAWDPWDLSNPAEESHLVQNMKNSRRTYRNRRPDHAANAAVQDDLSDPALAASRSAATISLHERFQAVGFGKVTRLGVGGQNVIYRFDMEDSRKLVHKVVVKVDLTNRSATRTELAVQKRMSGARHITQRLLLQAMPDPELDLTAPLPPRDMPTALGDVVMRVATLAISPRASLDMIRRRGPSGSVTRARRIRRARRELDDAEDVLVMEYMANRDLGSWLEKLGRENSKKDSSQRIRPPEKVLWSIFQCLWRGCIAMAWPGAQAVESNLDQRRNQIPVRTEYLPPGRSRNRRPADPLVHFNLNPSNVLMGDFDDEHFFPIVKISDFGLAKTPKWDVSGLSPGEQEKYLWDLRFRGQPNALLPEQTTEAWDFVANMDGLRDSALAGNYGLAANVFHIGLIMWQLVTTWEPEVPFVPRPYVVRILEREASGWTYGHALLDEYEDWTGEGRDAWPSETLRNTIAHCMDYMPRRRMNLTRLGSTIRQMLEQDWDQTDEECKQWSQQFFADAPTQSVAAG